MNEELDIKTLDIKECWNLFKTESEMTDTIYREVRFGIQIAFDINDYLNGYINIKPKTGKCLIRGKSYPSETLHSELELRERAMKEYLVQVLVPQQTLTPRGINYGK